MYISNRASDKITAVDDRIYCCRSGSAADTQARAPLLPPAGPGRTALARAVGLPPDPHLAPTCQAVSDYVRYFLDQHRMEYGQPPKARGRPRKADPIEQYYE